MKRIQFVDEYGSFRLEDPELISYLYFPLAGEQGVMSSVHRSLAATVRRDKILSFWSL